MVRSFSGLKKIVKNEWTVGIFVRCGRYGMYANFIDAVSYISCLSDWIDSLLDYTQTKNLMNKENASNISVC